MSPIEIFNNTTKTVRDDLAEKLQHGSRISIAAACFSIYAYQELKEQLESCDELRFIFTSQTFTAEKAGKERREFYIPRLQREKSIYGTEFEVRLRNEMRQKAIARECAEWIKRKARFRSNTTHENMNRFLVLEAPGETYTYMPLNSFTTVDLGCERGNNLMNMVTRFEAPASCEFLKTFNAVWDNTQKLADVTEDVIDMVSAVYQENSPELVYFYALYNIFGAYLEDVSGDNMPDEATGFKDSVIWRKLFSFQKDAALAIISKLEQYSGCILADSVGLGKTFTALAVIKYYEGRNKNVLVLCPKKLSENWMTYRANLINNPLAADKLRYDILYHTDLSRESGKTASGLPIEHINWGNYDLVVIDESHNFRNGTSSNYSGKENRYSRLKKRVIESGVKTKVLMLSATPVNNRFYDLNNQLALAYGADPEGFNAKLNTRTDINHIFRQAQAVYNSWRKLPEDRRVTSTLMQRLDADFFTLLDSVTIARSRKHIQAYYDTSDIGSFPERLKPVSLRPKLTDIEGAVNYDRIYEMLSKLQLTIYTPLKHVLPSRLEKYLGTEKKAFRVGREYGVQHLMSINLLKRMESSVHSFLLTARRIHDYLQETSATIQRFTDGRGTGHIGDSADISGNADIFDFDDINTEFFTVGKKSPIDLRDMDYISWKREIDSDAKILQELIRQTEAVTPEHDSKLRELMRVISDKAHTPINPGNRKILIFTAFADTAEYIYEHVSRFAKSQLGMDSALITGTVEGRTTIPGFRADMSRILASFSPISKEKASLYPDDNNSIDILIATDCISEGQNLQDCDYCISYDIHWNPVRIIQRFGRIDRIGSKNPAIQLVNFWPDMSLDEYINLRSRVEDKMRIAVMSSTGHGNPLEQGDSEDTQYRTEQLRRLQEEAADLEDMTGGISITDIGLSEFRTDLMSYVNRHPELERVPPGIHAVVHGDRPGVIFILKNTGRQDSLKSRSRLYPYYAVYVGTDGKVITDSLNPRSALDIMRRLSRGPGKNYPDKSLCAYFNKATKDGKDMHRISRLLDAAVMSVIDAKAEDDINSLFTEGSTTFLAEGFSGLQDFELICFLAVV